MHRKDQPIKPRTQAALEAVIERRQTIVRRLIDPVSLALSIMLPYVLVKVLISKDKEAWNSLFNYLAAEEIQAQKKAGDDLIAVAVEARKLALESFHFFMDKIDEGLPRLLNHDGSINMKRAHELAKIYESNDPSDPRIIYAKQLLFEVLNQVIMYQPHPSLRQYLILGTRGNQELHDGHNRAIYSPELRLDPRVMNKPFTWLTAAVETSYHHILRTDISVFENVINKVSLNLSFISAHKKILLFLAFASGLSKVTLMDPFLLKVYGLVNKEVNKSKAEIAQLTETEAKRILYQIRQKNRRQENAAWYMLLMVRVTMLINAYLLINQFKEEKNISPIILVLSLSTFTAVAIEIAKEMTRLYQRSKTNIQLSKCKKILEKLPGVEVTLNQGYHLNDSYFEISFNKYKNISRSLMRSIMNYALVKNGIPIISYDGDSICVSPFNLTRSQLESFNRQIEESTARLLVMKDMEKLLNSKCHGMWVRILTKENDLPCATYSIDLSLTFFHTNEIEQLKLIIARIQNGNETFLKINIAEPITSAPKTEIKVSPVEAEIKQARRIVTPKQPLIAASEAASPKNSQKPRTEISLPKGLPEKCKPIVSTGLTEGKNFVLFDIDPLLFPDDKDQTYNFIKNKVEEGRLAPQKKGAQGLQFRFERVKDRKKGDIDSALRCKILGLHGKGDIRVYAVKEEIGDINLYRFCSVNLHAHKKKRGR